MSKVSDASKADGSTGWFKVFEDGWAPANKGAADNDLWGTKDMNSCCGKVDVKLPTQLAAGDYLLRAEVIALHTAGQANGAQFYMSCCKFNFVVSIQNSCLRCIDQLTVSGGGSLSPATVTFPGAYSASDPGIKINIHSAISGYTIPGPKVITDGTSVTPGGSVCKKNMIRGANDIFSF
jgi:cellulase